jgi:hypothetical protein
MNRFLQRVMLSFAAVFGLSVVAIIIYAVYWQAPAQRCGLHGNWWDPSERVCAKPIFLPDITHRPLGSPKLKPGQVQMLSLPR